MKWIKRSLTGLLLMMSMPFLLFAGGIGAQAPDFSLPDLNDQQIALKHYQGQVILLNFWASWCAPCREELPALERLHHRFQEKGFKVVGINIDKKRKNAAKYVTEFNLSFPVLLDPGASVIQHYPGRAMPISYLIDRDGIIQRVFFGFNRDKLPEMRESVRTLLR